MKDLLHHIPQGRNMCQKSEEQRLLRAGAWKPLGPAERHEAWPEDLPDRTLGRCTQEVTESSLCPPQMPPSDLILSLNRDWNHPPFQLPPVQSER